MTYEDFHFKVHQGSVRKQVNMKVFVMFHERVYLSVIVVSVVFHHLRGVNPRNRILYFTLVSRGNNSHPSVSCFRIRELLLCRDNAIHFSVLCCYL